MRVNCRPLVVNSTAFHFAELIELCSPFSVITYMILDQNRSISQSSGRVSAQLRFALSFLIMLALWNVVAAQAKPVRSGHVELELLSNGSAIAPNDTIDVALHFTIDPEWHLYWTNPGDAGLPPKIKWNLPSGFIASDLSFPIPERISAGPLVSFGYTHELVLMGKLVAPQQLPAGNSVSLGGKVDWLVCKSECIPGEATVTLTLPVAKTRSLSNRVNQVLFQSTQDRLPVLDTHFLVRGEDDGQRIRLHFAGVTLDSAVDHDVFFYPSRKGVIENASPQTLTRDTNGYTLELTRSQMFLDTLKELSGILAVTDGDSANAQTIGYQVSPKITTVPPTPSVVMAGTSTSLLRALLYAFLGGLILNLMPCVLPVLSLKVLGLLQHNSEQRRSTLIHNLLYTLGVLGAFWGLASLLLILRAGGNALGWGFQLQSPAIVAILACFMFLVALNFLGVFEVGTMLTGVGGSSRRAGLVGSFVSGITATVVATPCTAPFMGTALGYSLTQPVLVSLGIFTSLGLGMAAPFVILTSIPGLTRFLPRPGRWMETLKHSLGFLLAASVIWLVWVFGQQTGATGILLLLIALLITSVCAWAYGRWGTLHAATATRVIVRSVTFVVLVTLVTTVVFLSSSMSSPQIPSSISTSPDPSWEPFSSQRVEQVRAAGKPLLIDFTASWCLSCKVNELVALNSADVQDRLKSLGIVTMKADWTNRDEEITAALAKFGRNSVPLYVLYSGHQNAVPILLPELLTPKIVLKALDSL